MVINPLRSKLKKYLVRHNLGNKYETQTALFIVNPNYPSLNTELLEPKEFKIYSFRIDRKYRAVFMFPTPESIEIIGINDHYR